METDAWQAMNDTWLRRYTRGTWVMAMFTIVIAVATVQQCRMNRDNGRPWLGATGRTPFVNPAGTVGYVEWHFVNGGNRLRGIFDPTSRWSQVCLSR